MQHCEKVGYSIALFTFVRAYLVNGEKLPTLFRLAFASCWPYCVDTSILLPLADALAGDHLLPPTYLLKKPQ